MEEDDCFVLDASLFNIVPSTPTLTEDGSTQPSHLARPSDSTLSRVGDQTGSGLSKENQSFRAQDEQDGQYEDPLADAVAEFEAWLNSGAVDIVEGWGNE